MNSKLKEAFENEMRSAVQFIHAERMEQAMRHLERVHVLGQYSILPHVRSHWHMLRIARRRHACGEGLGQVIRIILSRVGSVNL